MLTKITIAIAILFSQELGLQTDGHLLTGEVTNQQCEQELKAIAAEWPGLSILSTGCIRTEADVPEAAESPPAPAKPYPRPAKPNEAGLRLCFTRFCP